MEIKNPCKYFSGPGILRTAGEYIKEYSKKPLIIGGKRALDSALSDLKAALSDADIPSDNVEVFSGFPSKNQIRHYEEEIKEQSADAVIALGGGRALDTAKAAAFFAGVPVIAVPTVAATCAAWAALVIEYDDEGSYVGRILLDRSPVLVIADTKILLSTPKRYLFSGVVDTFAKFYEVRPVFEKDPSAIHMDIAYYASKLAFDKLEDNVFKALEEAEEGEFGQSAKDVADSIIYLAGFAGAFQTKTGGYCFAHPFYHISARFPKTRHRMHGEKVAFGILTQLFLEKRDKEYIREVVRLFSKYENAFTLDEIGFDRNNEDELKRLAEDITASFSYVEWSPEDILDAIKKADSLVKEEHERGESL